MPHRCAVGSYVRFKSQGKFCLATFVHSTALMSKRSRSECLGFPSLDEVEAKEEPEAPVPEQKPSASEHASPAKTGSTFKPFLLRQLFNDTNISIRSSN